MAFTHVISFVCEHMRVLLTFDRFLNSKMLSIYQISWQKDAHFTLIGGICRATFSLCGTIFCSLRPSQDHLEAVLSLLMCLMLPAVHMGIRCWPLQHNPGAGVPSLEVKK